MLRKSLELWGLGGRKTTVVEAWVVVRECIDPSAEI